MRKSVGIALLSFVTLAILAGRFSLFLVPARAIASLSTFPPDSSRPPAAATSVQGYSIQTTITPTASSTGRIVWNAEHGSKTLHGYALSLVDSLLVFEAGDGERSIAVKTALENPFVSHDIAATFLHEARSTRGTVALYIDGRLIETQSGELGDTTAHGELSIGSESHVTKFFSGTIGPTSIYPRALQSAEIILPYAISE